MAGSIQPDGSAQGRQCELRVTETLGPGRNNMLLKRTFGIFFIEFGQLSPGGFGLFRGCKDGTLAAEFVPRPWEPEGPWNTTGKDSKPGRYRIR